MRIISPHDKFFKAAMKEKRVARAFFKQYLPPTLLEKIDLESLKLSESSFVDPQLQANLSDLLFNVHLAGKSGYLYMLVEHQRKPDHHMAFRFLTYTLRIMAQHLKETGQEELPIVYPMLFFNGDSQYPYSTDLFTLFGDSHALAKQILCQPFQLIDLTQIPDTQLRQEAWLSIVQTFMKHATKRDIIKSVKNVLEALQTVERQGGQDYIEAAFIYLLNTSNVSPPHLLLQTIKDCLSPKLEASIMTIAEQLEARGVKKGIEQGIEQGIGQGIEQGKKMIALKLMQQGMPLQQIAQITELSLTALQNLYKENTH